MSSEGFPQCGSTPSDVDGEEASNGFGERALTRDNINDFGTRRYAESRLALKDARDLGTKLAPAGAAAGYAEEMASGKRAVHPARMRRAAH